MTSLLFLDLATTSGWAFGDDEGKALVSHGIWTQPTDSPSLGSFGNNFAAWIDKLLGDTKPDFLMYEAPFITAKSSPTTIRKLTGLALLVEMAAVRWRLRTKEVSNSAVRKHFVGVGRAPTTVSKGKRRQWIKDKVVGECRRRGFNVASDDDADALAGLSFGLNWISPGFVLKSPGVELSNGEWIARKIDQRDLVSA